MPVTAASFRRSSAVIPSTSSLRWFAGFSSSRIEPLLTVLREPPAPMLDM